MADDQTNDEATAEAQQKIAYAQFQHNVSTIIEQGREDFGSETFDQLSHDLVEAIGREALDPIMRSILQTEAPARMAAFLAENPDRAKQLTRMSEARRAASLAKIEVELMPNLAPSGDEPAWVLRARGGNKKPRMTDDATDAEFEAAWKLKYPNGYIPTYLGGPRSSR